MRRNGDGPQWCRAPYDSGDVDAILRGMTVGGARSLLASGSPTAYRNARLNAVLDSLGNAFDLKADLRIEDDR